MEDSVQIEVHHQRESLESDEEVGKEYENGEYFGSDSDGEDLEQRQLSYPPLPVYDCPGQSGGKDRVGLLTPMEEQSETEDPPPAQPTLFEETSRAGSRRASVAHETMKETGKIDPPEDAGRRVSFSRPSENGHLSPIENLTQQELEEDIENLIELQSRQERVLDWQEKHVHHLSSTEDDNYSNLLHMSEMDSSSIMKTLRSIPPSRLSTVVADMTSSLTTLRSQLSTLYTISLFGDRLRELQPYEYNLDLLPLIKKLCTLIGEARSPESSVTLGKLIQGAGPALVADDLLYIINSSSTRRKAPAIDGLTFSLLIFPRDDFDIEKVADAVTRCLWNSKRRIRHASLECLAVVAHVLGPGIAMPFLRELIEQNKPSATSGNPSGAVAARVSRHLLPSPSPMGLIDYGLSIPFKHSAKLSMDTGVKSGLDPIPTKGDYGGDILWILHGDGSSDSNSERSSSDSRGRGKSSKSGVGDYDRQPTEGHLEDEFLHLKHRESLAYEHEEIMKETLAEIKLQELERNYERSLEDDFHLDDDYVAAKTAVRDRDSGVSSLKSVRVASPTESSSSKSPVPDVDPGQVFGSLSSPPSISSQGDDLDPFVIRRPVMARSSRTSIASLSNQTGRVQHSPPKQAPTTLSTTASASSLEHTDWLKKSCPSKIPPRKAKSTSRDVGRLAPSTSNTRLPVTSRSTDSPKHGLAQALGQLSSSDWETTVDGFMTLSRFLRQHPEHIRSDLPTVNRAAILHLSNLRTQVTRAACLFFEDLFVNLGKSMEQDCEKIAEKLLDKTADTNKFIRDSSMRALEAMVKHLSYAKTIIPLENYGAKHRNSVVRASTAHVTRVLVEQLGPERILHQNPQKVLPMLIKFLQEGSLETRTHAKMALGKLVVHGSFDPALKRYIPSNTLKNVEKTISSIKNDVIRKG